MPKITTQQKDKVYVNFKAKIESRLKFKKIVQFSLLTEMSPVLEAMFEEFIENWETPQGREKILNKYFKYKPNEK